MRREVGKCFCIASFNSPGQRRQLAIERIDDSFSLGAYPTKDVDDFPSPRVRPPSNPKEDTEFATSKTSQQSFARPQRRTGPLNLTSQLVLFVPQGPFRRAKRGFEGLCAQSIPRGICDSRFEIASRKGRWTLLYCACYSD